MARMVESIATKPTLSITGVGGIPPMELAGNVLRPHTSLELSFRQNQSSLIYVMLNSIIATRSV